MYEVFGVYHRQHVGYTIEARACGCVHGSVCSYMSQSIDATVAACIRHHVKRPIQKPLKTVCFASHTFRTLWNVTLSTHNKENHYDFQNHNCFFLIQSDSLKRFNILCVQCRNSNRLPVNSFFIPLPKQTQEENTYFLSKEMVFINEIVVI